MFALRLSAPLLFVALAAGCAHQAGPGGSAPTSQPAATQPATRAKGATAKAETRERPEDVIEACRALVQAYAVTRDRVDSAAYGTLFADDAEFVFGENRVRGPAAIVALMQERARNTVTRHLMTTAHIRPVDAEHAEGISYFVVFSEQPLPKNDRPIPSGGPRAVIEYHDKFVRVGKAWKIQRREVKLVFALRN